MIDASDEAPTVGVQLLVSSGESAIAACIASFSADLLRLPKYSAPIELYHLADTGSDPDLPSQPVQ